MSEIELKPYTYIGKDGKAVLARDLEDQRDAAYKRIAELEKEISDLQQRIANGMKENMRLAGETVLKDKRIEELELALKNLINACDHSIKDQPEEYLCCPGDHCDCRGYTNLSYLKGGVNEARQTLKGDT